MSDYEVKGSNLAGAQVGRPSRNRHLSFFGGLQSKSSDGEDMSAAVTELASWKVTATHLRSVEVNGATFASFLDKTHLGVSASYHRVRWPAFVRSFVRHKVSCSNISITVRPRITKFYTDFLANLLFSHTWYDIPNSFRSIRSEVMARKTVENVASYDFGWNFSGTFKVIIATFYPLVGDNRLRKPAGYDVTSYFRSPFIEVSKKRPKMLPLQWRRSSNWVEF